MADNSSNILASIMGSRMDLMPNYDKYYSNFFDFQSKDNLFGVPKNDYEKTYNELRKLINGQNLQGGM